MKLSVAIIVKNEERIICRCLDSVSLFADEIVVMDTGSTDQTKEWAAKYPQVKLYDSAKFTKDTHFSDFSFSEAKNEAIRRCTGDWILWWDADDFADDQNALRIRGLAETESRDHLLSFEIAYGSMRFEHCRMFPSGRDIEFDETHACHEFLVTSGLPIHRHREVVIQHLPGHKEVPSSVRNVAILEKDYFARGRADARTLFYLANAYGEIGKDVQAVEFYDRYLEVSRWPEERFFARLYKARSCGRLGNDAEAEREAYRAMAEDSRFAEAPCLLGDLFLKRGDKLRAAGWFQLALAIPWPADAVLFASQDMYGRYPQARLNDCGKESPACPEPPVAPDAPRPTAKPKLTVRFSLPEGRRDAVLAMFALAQVNARRQNVRFEVVVRDDWQRDMVTHFPWAETGDGPAVNLSLNGVTRWHVVERFCRQAGVIPQEVIAPDWTAKHDRRACQVLQWSDQSLGLGPLNTRVLRDVASFSEAVEVVADSKLVVCAGGWGMHIAEALGVPTIVVWDGLDPQTNGWPDQVNLAADVTSEDLMQAVRRLSNAN